MGPDDAHTVDAFSAFNDDNIFDAFPPSQTRLGMGRPDGSPATSSRSASEPASVASKVWMEPLVDAEENKEDRAIVERIEAVIMFYVGAILRSPAISKKRSPYETGKTMRRFTSTRYLRMVVLNPCVYSTKEMARRAPRFFDETIASLRRQGKIAVFAHPTDANEFIVKYVKPH